MLLSQACPTRFKDLYTSSIYFSVLICYLIYGCTFSIPHVKDNSEPHLLKHRHINLWWQSTGGSLNTHQWENWFNKLWHVHITKYSIGHLKEFQILIWNVLGIASEKKISFLWHLLENREPVRTLLPGVECFLLL